MLGLKSIFKKKKKRKADKELEIHLNPQSIEENNLEQHPETQIDAKPAIPIEEKPENNGDLPQPKPESFPQVEPPALSQSSETKTEPEDANELKQENNAQPTSTNAEIEPENISLPPPNVPAKKSKTKHFSGKISSIRPWINK
jgi:hypothetical protein